MRRRRWVVAAAAAVVVLPALAWAGSSAGPGDRGVLATVVAEGGGRTASPAPTTAPGVPDDAQRPAGTVSRSASRPAVTAADATSDPAPPTAALTALPPPPPATTVPPAPPAPSGEPSSGAPGDDPAPAEPARERCDVGPAAGAEQVVVVRGSGQRATVRACSRTADGYVTDLGPFTGWVGRGGVAPAGAKREGDGRTPSGVFGLRGGFGVRADPGLAQGWFTVDADDVWVDDPGSALYNTHQRLPADGRWASAEQLANPPAYDYAQVIGYNEGATPGAGSAIFLHVATGGPTAGCVSLPASQLLEVLRWQRPGAVTAIS